MRFLCIENSTESFRWSNFLCLIALYWTKAGSTDSDLQYDTLSTRWKCRVHGTKNQTEKEEEVRKLPACDSRIKEKRCKKAGLEL